MQHLKQITNQDDQAAADHPTITWTLSTAFGGQQTMIGKINVSKLSLGRLPRRIQNLLRGRGGVG